MQGTQMVWIHQSHPSDSSGSHVTCDGHAAISPQAMRQFDQSKALKPKEWIWNTIMSQKTAES